MDLQKELKRRGKIIDLALDRLLPSERERPQIIHKAMRYSVFGGGKRLRPILTIAAAEAVGGDPQKVVPTACALELIHTYSLIHDDLPALDNDEFRRGQPTNHKVFGEDMAILAGDALLTHAFFLIQENAKLVDDPKALLKVIGEVALGAGSTGMIGGQVVDLESENQKIEREVLDYIHQQKTGALFRVAVRAGAILSGASPEQLQFLTLFAQNFGLAFQITDDILDVIGDANIIGKPVGSDEKNQKATYPVLFGLEKSKEMAQEAIDQALDQLEEFGPKAEFLKALTEYLIGRQY